MAQYVFIHGLGQGSLSWQKTISFLEKTDTFDCVDLWAMSKGEEMTYSNIYRAFSDYCNDIPEKLNLCGLSLGAILALNYAIDYPQKVRSIVLIGAQYKMPKGLLKFQNMIFRLMPKKIFQEMGLPKKDTIKLANSMADLDFCAKLKDISCSTLIVCGDKDTANKKAAPTFVEQIQNSEFQLIENAGHEVNIQSPEALANVLNAFWGNHNQ